MASKRKFKISNIFRRGSSYDGAGHDRTLKTWLTNFNDPNDEIIQDLPTLRERTRDLYKNNAIGRGVINTLMSNVIGRGLKYQSTIDRDFLGLSDEQADQWENNVERKFAEWSESKNADAAKTLNFFGLQSLAYLTFLQGGDSIALMPLIDNDDSISNLKIRLVEPDQLATPGGDFSRDNKIVGGVERGKNDEPIKYHFKNGNDFEKVDAFGSDSGRQNVILLFKPERPGQVRGVPVLSPVIKNIRNLGKYSESELIAALVSSYFTVFIKSNNPDALESPADAARSVSSVDDSVESDSLDYVMGPGAINQLQDNEEIQTANPNRPNSGYDAFIVAQVREIGMAVGIPFEILMKQFNSSFSASRAARIEFKRFVEPEQAWFSENFCQPIFGEWLTEEILEGRIDAPSYFQNSEIKRAWSSSVWIGQSIGQIQELQGVNAAGRRIELNLSTFQEETRKMTGQDWKKIMTKRISEQKLVNELNQLRNDDNEIIE